MKALRTIAMWVLGFLAVFSFAAALYAAFVPIWQRAVVMLIMAAVLGLFAYLVRPRVSTTA